MITSASTSHSFRLENTGYGFFPSSLKSIPAAMASVAEVFESIWDFVNSASVAFRDHEKAVNENDLEYQALKKSIYDSADAYDE